MKRKKFKIAGSTLFVFRPKNAHSGIDTDPMTTYYNNNNPRIPKMKFKAGLKFCALPLTISCPGNR